MQDDGKASREDLKNLILGSDDSDNKLKQRALLAMMEGGFKTAAGKSPYASVNIGEGGAEGVRNLSEGIAQIDADKRNRISQLVNLGLKGQELDQAAARLGLTKADIEAHAPYLAAQANLANTAARQNEVETGLLPQKFALEQRNAALRAAGATGGRPQMVSMSGSDLKPIQEKWGAMYNNPAAYAAQLGLSPTDLQYLKDDPKSPTSQRIIQDKVRPRVQAGFAQDYRNAEASKTKHAQGSYTPVFNP